MLLEDLETDLQDIAEEQERIIQALDALFAESDVEKSESDNYITYSYQAEDVVASFSIDNDTFKFTAYVTSGEGEASSTYSEKGDMDGIEDAAEKFLSELAYFLE